MELYETIAAYAHENGIEGKFEGTDMNDYLLELAVEYARQYQGTFEYMVDMRDKVLDGQSLSTQQAKGILNCAKAEARYRGWQPQISVEELTIELPSESIERYIPNGTYTVVFSDQSYRTIKLTDSWLDDAPENQQVAKFLSGSDNESSYTGFAFVEGQRSKIWNRYRDDSAISNALRILLEDAETAKEFGHAYALQSGRCYICNRTLTVPASISRGIGPECQKNLGW